MVQSPSVSSDDVLIVLSRTDLIVDHKKQLDNQSSARIDMVGPSVYYEAMLQSSE
jgi:hypothetical protein